MESDKELAKRVAEQDPHAFDALMRRYRDKLRAHLFRMVRDDATADDLAQDAALRVWQRAAQWNGRGPFAAWLMRIATNLALNHLRSVRRSRERPLKPRILSAEEGDEDSAPGWMVDASALGPDEIVDLAEQRELLGRLLDELPEERRELLHMIHDEEMKYEEVAEALGIPIGTVKSRLHYTLMRLGRQWLDICSQWENPK